MNNAANAGLQEGIDSLTNVKSTYEAQGITMTWADLMALAGQVGAEYGMETMRGHMDWTPGMTMSDPEVSECRCQLTSWLPGAQNGFVSPFTFLTGRQDCGTTAPYTDTVYNFPEPHMTHDEVMTFFATEFNFTDTEVI